MFISNEWRIFTDFLVLYEGIRGSKKAVTMKMLGQISNLPMALQNMLSLMMILKIKMILADSVKGRVYSFSIVRQIRLLIGVFSLF